MFSHVRDVVLYGGRPWGFTLTGGKEVSGHLYVAAVSIFTFTTVQLSLLYLCQHLYCLRH